MRSENSTINERSWVMNSTEKPSCCFRAPDLLHDFLLHDDVQGGGRLVHDQQGRMQGQGDGDHHPLAHPAGQLVRVGVQPAGVDVHDFQQLHGPGARLTSRYSPGAWSACP